MSPPRHSSLRSHFGINPSNLTLNSPDDDDDANNQAAYQAVEREHEEEEEEEEEEEAGLPSPGPPITNADLTPHQIAIKRARAAKARLATAHEGWTLAARALFFFSESSSGAAMVGVAGDDDDGELALAAVEMAAFGDAICGRYAAASFLWRVLADMPRADWFGPRARFDATLRRLRTLRGLEASLACWELLLLELMDLVDAAGARGAGGTGEKSADADGFWEEVRRVLGRWRRGLPSRP